MDTKTLRITLHTIGMVVAVAWFVEAVTTGRGFISIFLAPLAFGPLVAAAILKKKEVEKEEQARSEAHQRSWKEEVEEQ